MSKVVALSPRKPPIDAIKAAAKDSRIVSIVEYPDGWVPNSYKWANLGSRHVYERRTNGTWAHVLTDVVDKKRSGGYGPSWVCLSKAGGRLASG